MTLSCSSASISRKRFLASSAASISTSSLTLATSPTTVRSGGFAAEDLHRHLLASERSVDPEDCELMAGSG